MSTLYIRLFSKAAADSAPDWLSLPCQYAQVQDGGAIGRQGAASLSGLSATIAGSQRVVLLLAASDVTLLRVKVPPMSAARLKAALPNLAEDQLLSDPAECALAAGDISDGLRTIAVVRRAWLDTLAGTLAGFGAQRFAALPAQLCLPYPSDPPGSVAAAVNEQEGGEQGTSIDLTLRLSEHDGIGLAINPALSRDEGTDIHEPTAQEVIRTLRAVVPSAPVALYVPQSFVQAYQDAATQANGHSNDAATDNETRHARFPHPNLPPQRAPLSNSLPQAGERTNEKGNLESSGEGANESLREFHVNGLSERISVLADNWPLWIAGARSTTLDLMAEMGAGSGPAPDWRAWRWPMALAAAVMVINAAALNIDWWRMKSEAGLLRATMIQVYKSAYPKESVIVDPIAQMQQKIASAKHDSGLAAPDDFTTIIAAFGEAWANAMPAAHVTAAPAIIALEYRERSLIVRLRPAGEAATRQIKAALAKRDLSLDPAPEQSGAAVWQIRSAK
ncbi:MAG: hypothetical protein A2V79_02270 [Betaproteobacteria bacterium RBG_16_56_24]|nr:MAG: hypothetical protein A2V79_02270 [Betaproteobacteria bacterium RBG_16_56_24]